MAPLSRELLSRPSGLKQDKDLSQWLKGVRDQSRLELSAMRAVSFPERRAAQEEDSIAADSLALYLVGEDLTTPQPQVNRPSTETVRSEPASDTSVVARRHQNPMHQMGRSSAGDSAATQIFTRSEAYQDWIQPRESRFRFLFTRLYGPVGSATYHETRIESAAGSNSAFDAYQRNQVVGALQLLTLPTTTGANQLNDVQPFAPSSGSEMRNVGPVVGAGGDIQDRGAVGVTPGQPGQSSVGQAGGPHQRVGTVAAEMDVLPYNPSHHAFHETGAINYDSVAMTNPYPMYQQMNPGQVAAYANPPQPDVNQPFGMVQMYTSVEPVHPRVLISDGKHTHWGYGPPIPNQRQPFVGQPGPFNMGMQTLPMATMATQPYFGNGQLGSQFNAPQARLVQPMGINNGNARGGHLRSNAHRSHAIEIREPSAQTQGGQRVNAPRPNPQPVRQGPPETNPSRQGVVSYPQPHVDAQSHMPSNYFTAPR